MDNDTITIRFLNGEERQYQISELKGWGHGPTAITLRYPERVITLPWASIESITEPPGTRMFT